MKPADPRPIVELTLQGLTARQISERLGLSTRTIQRARVKAGIGQPNPDGAKRLTPEQHAYIRQCLADGWSLRETARSLGFNIDSLYRHYRGQGWNHHQVGVYARMTDTLRALDGQQQRVNPPMPLGKAKPWTESTNRTSPVRQGQTGGPNAHRGAQAA